MRAAKYVLVPKGAVNQKRLKNIGLAWYALDRYNVQNLKI